MSERQKPWKQNDGNMKQILLTKILIVIPSNVLLPWLN
jgi:hypothetical protein